MTANNGAIRFETPTTTPTTTSGERLIYVNSSNQLIFDDGSSTTALGSSGVVSSFSLNDAYDDGSTITVDDASVTLDANIANPALQITQAGAGADITGTSSTWTVSAAGAATFTGVVLGDNELITMGDGSDATIGWNGSLLNIAGATDFDDAVTTQGAVTVGTTLTVTGGAGSNQLVVTAGDAALSDGSLAITDGDNANTLTVTNNTHTTNSATTGGIVEFQSTSLTTGALLNLELTESALNGGQYLRAYDVTGGEDVFTLSEDGATVIKGAAAGTDALTVTAGDLFLSDSDGSIIESEDGTGTMLTLDNKAGVIASDSAVLLVDAGGAVASGGNLLRVAPTGTPNAGAIGIEYVGAGKTNQALYVDADPTGVDVVHFHGGGALTNGFAVVGVTNDGNLATGGALMNLTLGGTPNSAARVFEIDGGSKDAIAMYVDSDAATESAIQILGAGAIADNKAMVEIANTGTPAAAGSNLLRVDGSGLTATNKPTLAEIVGTGKDVSGLYLDTDNTTTHGVSIDGSGALNAGRMLLVDNDGTPAANTDAVVEFKFTGTATNNPIVLNVNNGTADAAPLLVTSNVASATRSVGTFVQDSTTGAKEVITLQQDDVSEEFIAFNSTAGSGNAVDLTNTTPASVAGSVLVTAVDGTAYRIALYAAAGWS